MWVPRNLAAEDVRWRRGNKKLGGRAARRPPKARLSFYSHEYSVTVVLLLYMLLLHSCCHTRPAAVVDSSLGMVSDFMEVAMPAKPDPNTQAIKSLLRILRFVLEWELAR